MIGSLQTYAQNGLWTWMRGPNTPNSNGSFGVQGVAAPGNDPPAVYEAPTWTDLNGNFWMFAGLDANFQEYSAMWKYDPVANLWTWMNGPNTLVQPGNYGVQGVPAPSNNPGARSWGPAAWTDNQGRLWMFGGYGYDANGMQGMLNDLWMYDVTTNLWTWMAGPNTVNSLGNYGVQLVPSPANLPPSRYEDNASWTDNSGNLWIYGGGNLSFNQTYSDMWMFDIGTNTWTWMAGSNLPNIPANFGVQQVANPANTPGGRIVYGKWKDCQGNFWIFGGNDLFGGGFTWADMWKFDLATLQWTWMAGSNVPNFQGSFNTQCVAGAQSPSARYENRTCWTDLGGRFWQYGGFGTNMENDLWMFDPNTNQFTWVSGLLTGNAVGAYGVMGVPSAANNPEGSFGAPYWTDLQGDFWMFGGWTAQSRNSALWRYQQDPNCPGPASPNGPLTALFTSNPDTGCVPLTVNFTSGNAGNFVYHWDFGDPNATNDTSNTTNSSYTYTATGTFVVSMIINGTSLCVSGVDTAYDTIVVIPPPVVNLGNDTSICGTPNLLLDAGNPGLTYSWSTGAITQTINANATGTYWVSVSNGFCSDTDTIVIQLAPPPSLGNDTTICQGNSITLTASAGASWNWNTGANTQTINVSSSGIYWVDVDDGNNCIQRDSILVTVNPMPVVQLGNDTFLCPDVQVLLDAGNPGATYSWSTGANSQTILTDSSGMYAVTVNLNNCIMQDSILLTFAEPVYLGDELTLCGVFEAELDAGNPNATSYLWNTGATTSTIIVDGPGNYWVQVNVGNCVIFDSIEVIGTPGDGVLYIPNTFTPNGNGTNDYFKPKGEGVVTFNMRIFDRWGELIFETDDMNTGWDGKRKGNIVQIDTYVYVIEYTTICSNGKKLRRLGHVNAIK